MSDLDKIVLATVTGNAASQDSASETLFALLQKILGRRVMSIWSRFDNRPSLDDPRLPSLIEELKDTFTNEGKRLTSDFLSGLTAADEEYLLMVSELDDDFASLRDRPGISNFFARAAAPVFEVRDDGPVPAALLKLAGRETLREIALDAFTAGRDSSVAEHVSKNGSTAIGDFMTLAGSFASHDTRLKSLDANRRLDELLHPTEEDEENLGAEMLEALEDEFSVFEIFLNDISSEFAAKADAILDFLTDAPAEVLDGNIWQSVSALRSDPLSVPLFKEVVAWVARCQEASEEALHDVRALLGYDPKTGKFTTASESPAIQRILRDFDDQWIESLADLYEDVVDRRTLEQLVALDIGNERISKIPFFDQYDEWMGLTREEHLASYYRPVIDAVLSKVLNTADARGMRPITQLGVSGAWIGFEDEAGRRGSVDIYIERDEDSSTARLESVSFTPSPYFETIGQTGWIYQERVDETYFSDILRSGETKAWKVLTDHISTMYPMPSDEFVISESKQLFLEAFPIVDKLAGEAKVDIARDQGRPAYVFQSPLGGEFNLIFGSSEWGINFQDEWTSVPHASLDLLAKEIRRLIRWEAAEEHEFKSSI